MPYRTQNFLLKVIKFVFYYIFGYPFYFIGSVIFDDILYLHPTVISYEEDKIDYWTFSHTLATILLSAFIYYLFKNLVYALIFGYIIMWFWEFIVDGFKISDRRGLQITDLGANFFGSLLFFVIYKLLS